MMQESDFGLALDRFFPPEYGAHRFKTEPDYRDRCERQARDWAKANKSDPYAYAVIMRDYEAGVAYAGHPSRPLWEGAQSYSLQWGQEKRTYTGMDGEVKEYWVDFPKSMRRM